MHPPTHIRLVAHGARRHPGQHDWPTLDQPPVPELSELLAVANAHRPEGITWLSGGEPTLRPDLPTLIKHLADAGHTVGLDTDGLALVRPDVLARLQACGLSRLRIPLHSIVGAAHDWIEGRTGSARRTRKTAAAARAAGIPLDIATLVTRSTAAHLVDTVRAAHALGARSIALRRPRRRGPAGQTFVTVSPRLGLAEPYLEAAAARGRDLGLSVHLDGFPRCTVQRVRASTLTRDRESWVVPASLAPLLQAVGELHDAATTPCARCPGPPVCAGAPADYVARFGRLELDDPGLSTTERPAPAPPQFGAAPPPPPPRAGRSPATRLRFAVRQAAHADLGGDPTAGMGRNPTHSLAMGLAGSTRDLKVQMVRLAQSGPAPLLVHAGPDLLRPEAHALLRELLRLGFTKITVRGDVTTLGQRSRRSLARLKGIHRFEAGLVAPIDPGATVSALTALGAATEAELGIRAVLPGTATIDTIGPWLRDLHQALPSAFLHIRFADRPDPSAWSPPTLPFEPKLAEALRSALERAVHTE